MYDPTITVGESSSKSILNYVPGARGICGSHFSWACGQHNGLPLLIKYICVPCYAMLWSVLEIVILSPITID